jgi:hypothetical protein
MKQGEMPLHPERPHTETRMRTKAVVTVGALLVALSLKPSSGGAQEKPFQLSFIGPTMQLVDDDADIKGLRINLIYGVNRNVKGLDLGLVNRATGDFKGLQAGLVSLTDGNFTGWQHSFVNVVDGEFLGFQEGFVNVMATGEGVQWGLYNSTQHLGGLQVALVNNAEDLYGLQIGLINIIRSKDRFPFLPIVNWKFEE